MIFRLLALGLLLALFGFLCISMQNGRKEVLQECGIRFSEDGIVSSNRRMAAVGRDQVVICADGVYTLTGSSENTSILVNCASGEVFLYLKDVDLTNRSGAVLYVKNASAVHIFLEGENFFSDAEEYLLPDSKPNACIYSESDLSIEGDGKLQVLGNCHNGIFVKKEFALLSGTLSVRAVNHGIRGRDLVSIRGGRLRIIAGNDGIQVQSNDRALSGKIEITDGECYIKAQDDGLQAEEELSIQGGKVFLSCGGKLMKCDQEMHIEDNCVIAK